MTQAITPRRRAWVLLLWLALARIGFLVDERQSYQVQAVQSVQQSQSR